VKKYMPPDAAKVPKAAAKRPAQQKASSIPDDDIPF